MNELFEQLDENTAKLRLLKQDIDRIKINPIYSLHSNAEALRQQDLLGVVKKSKRTLVRRYKLVSKVAQKMLSEMDFINEQLKELKQV